MFGKKTTLMLTVVVVTATAVILFGAVAQAADSIAIKFGANEPSKGGSALGPDEVAGAPGVDTANWNNASEASGTLRNLTRDTDGEATQTDAVVQWLTTNTWCSIGCGGEFNNNFTGANRKLMGGYLDQNTDGVTSEVLITGLPDDMAESYDVYIYLLGGVPGRGGEYIVNTVRKSGTVGGTTGCGTTGMAPCNGPDFYEDPGDDHTTRGNYLYFGGLSGNRVAIQAMNSFGETPRAAINAVQIVSPSAQ